MDIIRKKPVNLPTLANIPVGSVFSFAEDVEDFSKDMVLMVTDYGNIVSLSSGREYEPDDCYGLDEEEVIVYENVTLTIQ